MKNSISIFSMLFILTVFVSCGGQKSAQEEKATIEEPKSEPKPAYSGETVAGTTHTVEDYTAWEKVYLEVSDPESRVGVLRGIENPNLVAVYEYTKSHEDARASLNSEELKGHMQRAGVNSDPETTYFDMKFMTSEEISVPFRLAISHEVKDYDSWKTAFDNDKQRQDEGGLSLIGMATGPENPNMVYIMFGVEDVDKAKAVIEDPELIKVMEEAGVISEPTFTFWQIPENVQ
jgi:hypothetical protein